MGVVYVVSIIALLIVFMLLKKSDEKLNVIGILGLGIVLILCYNAFECYILNFFRIKLTLLNLVIVNYVIVIIALAYILRKKTVQKYYVAYWDVIAVTMLAIIVILIGEVQFGPQLNVKYETSDASVHYRAAQNFARSDNLLNFEHDYLYGLEVWKIGSYVNSGLIMKVFSPIVDEFDYYKIFVLFDLFILFMTGYLMYVAVTKFSKDKVPVIALIISLLFMLGYPLNGMIYGFQYLNMGILIVTTLLYAVQIYATKYINLKHAIIILFLLTFQLFHSYYQFVPYIYSALFIYICFANYKESKKIFTKKNIIQLLVILIIPFLLGFVYYFAQSIYSLNFGNISEFAEASEESGKAQQNTLSSFSLDGYVYNNLYTNVILLLPLAIYVIIKELKDKKIINFTSIATVLTIGYIIMLIIGNQFGWISDYYVSKNYFALWIILWYMNFKGLYYIYQNKEVLSGLLIGGYICILLISYANFDITKVNNILKNYSFRGFTEVYNVNGFIISQYMPTFFEEELEIMEYANKNLDKTKKIEMLGNEYQILWAYPLLNYYYTYPEMSNQWFQHKLMYKYRNNEVVDNADYVICFYRTPFYRDYDKSKIDGLEVIYENQLGKIVKR